MQRDLKVQNLSVKENSVVHERVTTSDLVAAAATIDNVNVFGDTSPPPSTLAVGTINVSGSIVSTNGNLSSVAVTSSSVTDAVIEGAVVAQDGINLASVGGHLKIQAAPTSSATVGKATMNSDVATVVTSAARTTSKIFVTRANDAGGGEAAQANVIANNGSFQIVNAGIAFENSIWNWFIIN